MPYQFVIWSTRLGTNWKAHLQLGMTKKKPEREVEPMKVRCVICKTPRRYTCTLRWLAGCFGVAGVLWRIWLTVKKLHFYSPPPRKMTCIIPTIPPNTMNCAKTSCSDTRPELALTATWERERERGSKIRPKMSATLQFDPFFNGTSKNE
jgi:hypothetical protein